MKKTANRVKVSTGTTGPGTVTTSTAVSSAFCSFAEAVPALADGDVVEYMLTDGGDEEQGEGTIGGSVTTMSRDKVLQSKIGGVAGTTKIALSGNATLSLVPSAQSLMFAETHGADIASAGTINLETSSGELVDVTGTAAITAITLKDGHVRTVRFTGVVTLTNGSNLVLPGGANITTATGDFAIFRGYAAGVVRCVAYALISGRSIVAPSGPTLLATLTASSSASLSDTTHITSTYNAYQFIFRALTVSGTAVNLHITYSTDGGSTYLSSGYAGVLGVSTYIGLLLISQSGSTSQAPLYSTGPVSGSLIFSNPNAAIASGAVLSGNLGYGGTAPGLSTGYGANSTTSVINAIKFAPSTGNFTSGSIEIWGIP